MTATDGPGCCQICGYYLTKDPQFRSERCVDPGHWQAAGLLKPYDYYRMAEIVTGARAELDRRYEAMIPVNNHQNGKSSPTKPLGTRNRS
jgi:hypothetical protein